MNETTPTERPKATVFMVPPIAERSRQCANRGYARALPKPTGSRDRVARPYLKRCCDQADWPLLAVGASTSKARACATVAKLESMSADLRGCVLPEGDFPPRGLGLSEGILTAPLDAAGLDVLMETVDAALGEG